MYAIIVNMPGYLPDSENNVFMTSDLDKARELLVTELENTIMWINPDDVTGTEFKQICQEVYEGKTNSVLLAGYQHSIEFGVK